MTTQYILKSGKTFDAPALFVTPQSTLDALELKNTLLNYNNDTEYIEGIVIALKDWTVVNSGFSPEQTLLINENYFNDKLKILDSSLHILFQGYSEDKNKLMNINLDKKKIGEYQLISGGLRLRDAISAITALDRNKSKEKNESYIRDIYPYMDNLISPVMKFGIENKFDIISIPSVPITYPSLMHKQIAQAAKMNKVGKILADTLFSKEMKKRDLMFMATINMSVIKQKNYDDLISMLIINDENSDEIIFPDQIGIRLMNEDPANTESVQEFLDFIARLAKTIKNYKKEILIHIFNVRENGYVTFAYGATTVTSPIATSQYIRRSLTNSFGSTNGKYYHPAEMMDYKYEKLLALSRSFEYILPCHCKVCQMKKNFLKAKEQWNSFRRQHFILVKHLEMMEIKEAPTSVLHRHLQQKFSRSKQTVWLAFLDQQPILTFN